jgi:adenylate cyclase
MEKDPTDTLAARRRWRPSLRLVIGLVLAGMVTLTAVAIIVTSHRRSARTVVEVSEELILQAAHTSRDQVQAFLESPQGVARLLQAEASSESLDPSVSSALESHFFDLISVYPDISMLNWGTAGGDFLMVKRLADGAIWTKQVQRSGLDAPVVSWVQRDVGATVREVLAAVPDPSDRYDPRTRPWYQGAEQAGAPFWSDVYVFWSDRAPGLTLAVPHSADGALVGVFGVDINLEQLSGYLAELQVSEHGLAFALDRRGRLVAAQDAQDQLTSTGAGADEKLELRSAADASTPEIAALARTPELAAWLDGGAIPDGSLRFEHGGEPYLAAVVPIGLDPERDWVICVAAPASDFMAQVRQADIRNTQVGALLTLLALLVSLVVSRWIGNALEQLVRESSHIRDLRFEAAAAARPPFRELAEVVDAFERMKVGLRSFQLYLPIKLVRQLLEAQAEPRLGGETREVTIYFSDIAGFTPITESLGPMLMAERLGEYLAAVSACIQDREGTVVQYVGDEVMAFWGAPLDVPKHVELACDAAIAVQDRLDALWDFDDEHPRMPTRVGLHTERVAVGHFGSADRMYYGAIGDGVVLASRLEGLNKLYGTRILVSETTAIRVLEHFELRRLDRVTVKGRVQPTIIYELLGRRGSVGEDIIDFARRYEAAVDLYLAGDWATAVADFDILRAERPDDGATRTLLARCMAFGADPPEAWAGYYAVTVK